MRKALLKNKQRSLRGKRIRSQIFGTATKPRFCVFRSNTAMYVQLIDDSAGKTLVSGTFKEAVSDKKAAPGARIARASALGKLIAEKAKKAGISVAVFDRGHYAYHGRIKALADGAREGGLKL